MNRSTLYFFGAILLAGLLFWAIYMWIGNDPAYTNSRTSSGISNRSEDSNHSEKDVRSNDISRSKEAGSRSLENPVPATSDNKEKARDELINKMSNEERLAKPEGMPMGKWALHIAYHKRDLKKNGEVNFFGRVVDQDGKPLVGVVIFARVSSYDPSITKVVQNNARFKEENFEIRTDKQGTFKVVGTSGVSLGLSVFKLPGFKVKENAVFGYSFVPEGIRSQFGSRHESQPGNPVVFTMEKID